MFRILCARASIAAPNRPLQTTIFFELKTAESRSIGTCSLLSRRRIGGRTPTAPSENHWIPTKRRLYATRNFHALTSRKSIGPLPHDHVVLGFERVRHTLVPGARDYIVSTTRNSAFQLIIRTYPSAALASEYQTVAWPGIRLAVAAAMF